MPFATSRLALTLIVTLSVVPAHAADVLIAAPPQSAISSTFASANGSTFAVGLGVNAAAPSTGVLQWHPITGAVTTALPGKVFGTEVAPGGGRVLVGHVPGGAADESTAYVVLSAGGQVLWSANLEDALFSTDGQSVCSQERIAGGATRITSRRAADGAVVGVVETSERVRAYLAIGDGRRILIALGMSVVCFDTATGGTHAWRYDLPTASFEVIGLRALGGGRILLQKPWGCFAVLDESGTVLADWNALTLDDADPEHDWTWYARFRPYPSPMPGTILVYDGETDARAWNPSMGSLTPLTAEFTPPVGFKRMPALYDGRLLFVGATSMVVRTLD